MIEMMVRSTSRSSNMHGVVEDNNNPYRNMVMDAMRMNQSYAGKYSIVDEEPNIDEPGFLIFWKIMTNHYGMSAQIIVNY